MTAASRLHRDERGAVMVMGLFMGTFLIGATWFIFGVARTAIFRQRVQETADSAAFSSAALHAKGMNLIAAINLVMFALTAIWMLLRTFEDAMHLLQTSVVWNAGNCHGRFCRVKACEVGPLSGALTASGLGGPGVACRIAHTLQEVRDKNKDARQTIGDRMWEWFPRLSKIQDVTARVAPLAGTTASLGLGLKYQHFTIALSASLIPGQDIARLVDAGFTKITEPDTEEERIAREKKRAEANKDAFVATPLGLPVVQKKFGTLCGRTVKVIIARVKELFGFIPPLETVLNLPIVKNVVDGITNGTAGYLENELCSDADWAGHEAGTKIFRERGPKIVFGHAENGNDLMQIWAFTWGGLEDKDLPRVGIAGRTHDPSTPKSYNWYVAQAEFYFDCDAKWSSAKCNGLDNSMYNMRWRARLRRVRQPNVTAELTRYLRDALFSAPVKKALQSLTPLAPRTPKPGEAPLTDAEKFKQKIYDDLFTQAFNFGKSYVSKEIGAGNGATGRQNTEMLH